MANQQSRDEAILNDSPDADFITLQLNDSALPRSFNSLWESVGQNPGLYERLVFAATRRHSH